MLTSSSCLSFVAKLHSFEERAPRARALLKLRPLTSAPTYAKDRGTPLPVCAVTRAPRRAARARGSVWCLVCVAFEEARVER